VSGVSNAVPQEQAGKLPETAVRNRSQYAETLHRLDPDADGPKPACPEADRPGADFSPVELAAYRTYDLCQNPECFGGGWR
jgi:hypothetical protein